MGWRAKWHPGGRRHICGWCSALWHSSCLTFAQVIQSENTAWCIFYQRLNWILKTYSNPSCFVFRLYVHVLLVFLAMITAQKRVFRGRTEEQLCQLSCSFLVWITKLNLTSLPLFPIVWLVFSPGQNMRMIIGIIWPLILGSICTAFPRNRWQKNYQRSDDQQNYY